MSFKLIDSHLAPAEGEITVRTYHCTRLSPVFALIGLVINGYLTVTNKRVVFFATGSSWFGWTGNSKLYTDVPIADVANMSMGQGTRFSLMRLFGALLASFFVGAIVAAVQVVVYFFSGVHDTGSPYLLRLGVFVQLSVAMWLFVNSLWFSRENGFRVLFASGGLSLLVGIMAIAVMQKGTIASLPVPYYIGMLGFLALAFCYWIICLYWFIRREYLTMTISSKSGMFQPIEIVGLGWWWGIVNFAASLARNMAPAADANLMFKELGALVTDIQTLGDHGVEKWLQNKPDAAPLETQRKQQDAAHRRTAILYAVATMLVVGVFVSGESIWCSIVARKNLAVSMRAELAEARSIAESDKLVKKWVPKMWALAEQEEGVGEAAYVKKQYDVSMLHWQKAIKSYKNMPEAAAAMASSFAVQLKYDDLKVGVYAEESVSERLKSGNLMTNFVALMIQHPSSNEDWKVVNSSASKAKVDAEQGRWDRSQVAWNTAGARLPPSIQLMRADLWVTLAEKAIKKGDAHEAYECAQNALKEDPTYVRAVQCQELAKNMIRYHQQFISCVENGTVNATNVAEFVARLDSYGGANWVELKSVVEKARALANQDEWGKCNAEWKKALSTLPAVVLTMQMEKLESEARRGNWATVSGLADIVLSTHPDHQRASELKDKAGSIESAYAAQRAYQQTFEKALLREVESDHVKKGDLSDFIAYMDRYGYEEWTQVKDATNSASSLSCEERGVGSSNEWMKACALLPSAIQRVRAEIWMERAELEKIDNNWPKVLAYAENALKEKPAHVKVKQLRDRADGIEEMRFMRMKYEQILKDASGRMTDIDCKTNDQTALLNSLAQYGGLSWETVKSNVKKASEFEKQERRVECVAAWMAVFDAFPIAIKEMRSGYWLAKAESDAKNKMWGKVSVEAERALVEDPENERAKTLKSEADKISK